MSDLQTGVVLHAGPGREATQVEVPRLAADHSTLDPRSYAPLLPGAAAEHLLLAAVPFSEAAGQQVLLIYDSSGAGGEPNPQASRLTIACDSGLQLEVKGDALALYAQPGAPLGVPQWEELDNVLYDELLEYFGQGLRPSEADVQRLVDDFKAGRFRYSEAQGGAEDEDANKDDGGESLEEALEQAQLADPGSPQ